MNKDIQRPPHFTQYYCEACNYYTNKHNDYIKHTTRAKHIYTASKNELNNNVVQNDGIAPPSVSPNVTTTNGLHNVVLCSDANASSPITVKHSCCCGKQYKYISGLWKHQQKCSMRKIRENDEHDKESTQLTSVIMMLVKQNQDLHKQILDIAKDGRHVVNNNIQTNISNTTHFNLQVFLNETCKDALNMIDFINLMKVELTDLEEIGRLGYSDGVSRIFVNGLKELEAHRRPIHCSDLKREVLYIKEDNVWEKDNEEKTRIRQAIRRIEHKNIKQIPLWIKANPDAVKGTHKQNTQYLNMVCQSSGGDALQGDASIKKIIRNVAREVLIDKTIELSD